MFSSTYGKNLLFKDSTQNIVPLPPSMDAFLYLGTHLYNSIKGKYGKRLEVLNFFNCLKTNNSISITCKLFRGEPSISGNFTLVYTKQTGEEKV